MNLSQPATQTDIVLLLSSYQQQAQKVLEHYFDQYPDSALIHAMRYSTLSGGKRIRAALVYATANICGKEVTTCTAPAAAIELIHAFSLIHDDLPAMDDDTLRRGKPACHIAFDEATAILAGDALQTLAFEILVNDKLLSDSQKLSLIQILASASGYRGMAGGQFIDVVPRYQPKTLQALTQMHQLKTGRLIEASVKFGLICGERYHDRPLADSLITFAGELGLAFQIQDDILDETIATQTLGKPALSDQKSAKATYPSLLGLAKSRELLNYHYQNCMKNLNDCSIDTTPLQEIVEYLITRSS